MNVVKLKRNTVAVLGALVVAAVWYPGLSVQGKQQTPAEAYTIISLGTLGGNASEAYALSENGIIGGSSLSNLPGGVRAFVYQNGALNDLGFAGDVFGVNTSGQAAGRRAVGGGSYIAFRFDGQQVVDLGTLGGSESHAYAINSAGDVVGGAHTSANDYHAFLSQSGGMTDLETLGGTFSFAYDINDSGMVVGESTILGDQESRTVIWAGGTMTAVQPPGAAFSYGFAVNDAGQIAIGTYGATSQGFLYTNGTFIEITSLGGNESQPLGLNDWGDVVGYSTTAGDAAQHAFIFKDGATTDLNDLLPANSGWVLREASDINNAGAIVGVGFFNGDLRAFLMTPTDATPPEVSCSPADGAWHNSDVTIACTASDPESGLANAADANFSLITSVPSGTETATAATDSRQVCNTVALCTTAGPIAGNKVDRKPATVTVTSPGANATYQLNASVAASYVCSDGGSGLATCQGPAANGAPIDTSSIGAKTFTVTATDSVGNQSTQVVTYNVVSGGGGGQTSADLGITLTAPAKVSPGETLTYSMTVTNGGQLTATAVTVSDALPAGTVFASASTSQGTLTTPAVGSNGTVTANLGNLAKGASATVGVVVTVTAASGTDLFNTVIVGSTTQDLNSNNNSTTKKTTVSKK